MRELKTIRFGELIFICSIFIIYTTRRLFEESWRIERLIIELKEKKVPSAIIWGDLENYNHFFNTMLPIILPALLFLGSWYIFHFMAYPKIKANELGYKELIYCCLVILLIGGGVFIYHYLKLNVNIRVDRNEIPIGFKIGSLYRKVWIFSNFVAVCIIIGMYEFAAQLYYYLHHKLQQEVGMYIEYILLICLAFLLLRFASNGQLPDVLWFGKSGEGLSIGAIILNGYVLQSFLRKYVLGFVRPRVHLVMYFVLCLAGASIIAHARIGYNSLPKGRTLDVSIILFLTSIIWAHLRRTFSAEKTVLQTLISKKSAELSTLQAQINPHFLFNALNSLYAIALREGGEKTAEGIQKLGDMMRFMLHENNRDRILLTKEIEYLHNYIEIQRMRIDESHNIEIRVNIQEPDKEIYISPMMLNPFVENAFKHGISFRNPSWIYITLTLDATSIYFKVHNSIHPHHTIDLEEGKSGVGLDNVKKRLELIYSNRHKLEIQKSDQDYFISLTLGYW